MMALLFALLTTVWAGNRVGNGGNVIDCPGKKPVLLDFYEVTSSDKPLAETNAKGVPEILKERLAVLHKVAPKLADQYEKRSLEVLTKEFGFKTGVALTEVQDSLHAYVPEGCKVHQIVIRQEVPLGDKRFLVDQKLWDALDARGKAGLVMHEVIYEHLYKLGETTSLKARRLNALLFSPELEKMNSGQFWLFVKKLEVPVYP